MVSTDADNMGGRRFGKPLVNVLKCFRVLALEAAKVTAMNEQVTRRNGKLTVTSVGVCNDANLGHMGKQVNTPTYDWQTK